MGIMNYKRLFPLIAFDVRHHSELVNSNVMSVKLHYKFSNDVLECTIMDIVIISDRVMKLTFDGQTPLVESTKKYLVNSDVYLLLLAAEPMASANPPIAPKVVGSNAKRGKNPPMFFHV